MRPLVKDEGRCNTNQISLTLGVFEQDFFVLSINDRPLIQHQHYLIQTSITNSSIEYLFKNTYGYGVKLIKYVIDKKQVT